MRRVFNFTAVLCVLICMLIGVAVGQSTGTISGAVRDSSNSVIPGATVTARNQGTGITRTAVSSDAGQYVLPLLPIGAYTLSASLTGFSTIEIPDVLLEVGQNRVLDITMSVGQVQTGITVTSGISNVELSRSDATIGQVVHGEQVENLPLNGRNFVQLALLGPGTTTGRLGSFLAEGPSSEVSYRGTMSVSAQGMRENANDWLYDGVDNNELSAGGIGILPSIETIAEFKVLTYNFSAQYGSRGGTTILVSTKSGTNGFHGSLFNFHRNDVLDARNFFDGAEKGKLIRNQYGFSVGGPIQRDRTFFFGGFEGTNLRQGLTVQSTVPTAAMHNGDFSESFPDAPRRTVFDPSSTRTEPATGMLVRDPFPGNIIPAGQIDPIGKAVIDLMPLPTRTDRLGNNFLSNPVKTLDNYSFYGRVDHEIGENDKLFVRISTEDGDSLLPSGVPGFASRSAFASNQTFKTDARNIATAYTHLFSPTTINQFSAGYNRVFNFISSFGFGTNKSQALGIPGANLGTSETSSLTRMSFQNFIGVGDRGFSPFQGGTNVFHLGDTLTLVRGAHTLNVGGVFRANQLNQFGDTALAGAFSFNTSFTAGFTPGGTLDGGTGSSIASALMGLPSSGQRTDLLQGSVKGRRWKEYRGFVDDTWKVSPDLTLNLGFAYSVSTPQTEAADRFTNFDFFTGQIFVGGTVGVKTDYGNVQPRIGFSWSPGGSRNMVLRGGYGLFYDYAAQGGAQGPQANPPFVNNYFFSSDNITPVRTLATGFPDNSQPVAPADHRGNWDTRDPNLKNGRIQQWNVNIERKLPGQMVFMASYAGTHGDRLFRKGLDLNTAPPGFPLFNPSFRRPYPNLGSVNATLSEAFLDYHSMQLRLERRATEGGFLLVSYTWSKGLTDGQSGLGGDPGVIYSAYLKGADKAANNTDLRHNFRLSYLYELPFGSSLTGVPKAFVHGWNINSMLLAHSGYPLAMTVFNLSGTSGFAMRPNRVCDGGLNNPSIDRWFDVSCFPAAPVGTVGNAARTTLFGPGRWNLDLSLSKEFAVTDGSHIEFRTEFFNALNHAQFAVPNTGVDGFSAGRISSTVQTSRQIQFALKYIF